MLLNIQEHSFSSIRNEWDELVNKCNINNVFLCTSWQELWWDEFGEGDLRILSLSNEHELLGIAPFHLVKSSVRFLGDTDLFDYHDFIIVPGNELIFFQKIFEWLNSQDVIEVILPSIPDKSTSLNFLSEISEKEGWKCIIKNEDVCPSIELPSNWDDYLSSLRKKDRHELRRKFRRLENFGSSEIVTLNDHNEISKNIDSFFYLMRESRSDKDMFLTTERENFFRNMAEKLSKEQLISLSLLYVESKIAAATICFDFKDTRFLYNSGFDHEYDNLSVGLLLKASCIQNAIETGFKYFDFLRGDEPYKYHLGGIDQEIFGVTLVKNG